MSTRTTIAGLVTSQAPLLDDEQHTLAGVVRELVHRHRPAPPGPADPPPDQPSTLDDQLWPVLATQVGIAGLGIPEALGGAGGTYLECHLVLTELGGALAVSPYLATLLASQELLIAQPGASRSAVISASLDAIASGERTATVLTGTFTATGPDAGGGWQLTGHAGLVLDGDRAGLLLARAETNDGLALFEVAPSAGQQPGAVQITPLPTMDRALHLSAVTLAGAGARFAGSLPPAQIARLDALRPVAASAIQIGGARHCLEVTVEYLRTRTQFGRPLGSFQSLKHRLADLLVLTETAESASWGAAAAWADDAADAGLLAAAAGSYCGQAYRQVSAESVQLHGGIAITWEHEAHRQLKQAHTMATLFGTPSGHRAKLIHDLGLH